MPAILAFLALACGPPSVEAPVAGHQLAVQPDAIPWGPCPPGLPEGCGMAVLEGSPGAAQLFTIRLKVDEPFTMPPHTHPANERLTVLEGTVNVGFGDTLDKSAGTAFGPGAYYVNKAGAAHFVWSDGPVSAQITGIGPWKVEPVE